MFYIFVDDNMKAIKIVKGFPNSSESKLSTSKVNLSEPIPSTSKGNSVVNLSEPIPSTSEGNSLESQPSTSKGSYKY